MCEVSEAWPDFRPGQNSMNLEKRMELWCFYTKRGKTNDLDEACLSTRLSTTKSLSENVLDKIRIHILCQAHRFLRLTVF